MHLHLLTFPGFWVIFCTDHILLDCLMCPPETLSLDKWDPQRTVLFRFLFTLYTVECRHCSLSCRLQTFSDNVIILGCIHNDDDSVYWSELGQFVSWCDSNVF